MIRPAFRSGAARRLRPGVIAALVAGSLAFGGAATDAQIRTTVDEALAAVVRISATVPGGSRSAAAFGTEREGSGAVIDGEGLVLTIGYLIAEADSVTLTLADGRTVAANPVAYDHDSGFGLVRAIRPLGVKPLELGSSAGLAQHDQAVVASWGGPKMAMPALVMARSTFIGYWEYLLENAIFTAPPHPAFGGAALLSAEGHLLGIGSLTIADGVGPDQPVPCNMFVPIDRLKPILAELLEKGRAGPKQPWIGLSSEEINGRLFVTRVTEGAPAHAAGIRPGDLVLGVGGQPVNSLEEFYRKLWGSGEAGMTVPIDVLQGAQIRRVGVASIDHHDFLRLNRSY